MAFSWAILVLANTDMISEIPIWVKELPAVGALVWYLWYSTSRTIPRIVQDHKDAIETLRGHQELVLDKITTKHQESIKGLTDSFTAELGQFREHNLKCISKDSK